MSVSPITLSVQCPACSSALVLSFNGVGAESVVNAKTEERQINGKLYELQYFVCPHCNEWVFIQVDDERSRKVRARNVEAYLKLLGGSKHRQTQALYERTKSDLTIMRTKLEKALEGKYLYDPWTGSKHELKFMHLGL